MLGRVLAFYTLGAMAAAMAGITLFGWITGQFGVPAAVVSIGVVMAITGLSAWQYLNHVPDRPPKREAPLARDRLMGRARVSPSHGILRLYGISE